MIFRLAGAGFTTWTQKAVEEFLLIQQASSAVCFLDAGGPILGWWWITFSTAVWHASCVHTKSCMIICGCRSRIATAICTLFDNVWQIFSSSKQKFLEEGGIQCIFDFSLILLGCSGWTSATHVFCTFYYQATKPMNSYEPYVVTKTNPLHETFEHTPNCQHVLHPRPSAPPSCAPRLEIRSCFGAWALNCRPRYPSRCSLAQVTFAERFLYERGWILV